MLSFIGALPPCANTRSAIAARARFLAATVPNLSGEITRQLTPEPEGCQPIQLSWPLSIRAKRREPVSATTIAGMITPSHGQARE